MNKTIKAALAESIRALNTDSAKLDVEILLAHALKKTRSFLFAWPEKEIMPEALAEFYSLLERRRQHEPIAYLTGSQEFWSLPFKVSADTLIPRPETELLVQSSLETGKTLTRRLERPLRLIDLGTGSGCIALAIAHEEKSWQITASDISNAALKIARENARNLNINNVQFQLSDWLKNISESAFDLIISNPPYIAEGDTHLQNLGFEPASALSAGVDGLDAIAEIGQDALTHLNPHGVLLFEIGYDQAKKVKILLQDLGYSAIEFKKDLAGHHRVCIARLASD